MGELAVGRRQFPADLAKSTAYRKNGNGSSTLESTAKKRSTEKVPQKSTAKSEPQATFAVLDVEDDEGEFDIFAVLDSDEWRIERRYRARKDGQSVMYWNYRRRKIHHDDDGNRRIAYRKGGRKLI